MIFTVHLLINGMLWIINQVTIRPKFFFIQFICLDIHVFKQEDIYLAKFLDVHEIDVKEPRKQ